MRDNIVLGIAFLFGAAASLIWVNSLGLWALHIELPIVRWIWENFSLKGYATFAFLDVIHSVIMGLVFAFAIHVLNPRGLKRTVLSFIAALLVSFYAVGAIQATDLSDFGVMVSTSWLSVVTLLASVAIFSAMFARFLKRAISRRAKHDAQQTVATDRRKDAPRAER